MPQSSQTTELASGQINKAHRLRVVLQEHPDNPPVVLIHWPDDATITTPYALEQAAAKATMILAQATVRLSQIRSERKL